MAWCKFKQEYDKVYTGWFILLVENVWKLMSWKKLKQICIGGGGVLWNVTGINWNVICVRNVLLIT